VLARVNDQLCPNMPPNMFATCLYLVLEPASGRLEIANAGHNLPYLSGPDGVREIRATGMPLGLMQGMEYEEMKAEIGLDETLLLFSDGLVEAHNPRREMFGFPRLKEYFARNSTAERLVDSLMSELRSFTGPGWEQEDDVTLVVLRREDVPQTRGAGSAFADHEAFEVLADFCVPSEPGNERVAISEVTAAVSSLDLPKRKLEALGTAVGEAAMNAMEHGNQFRAELPIEIKVFASKMEITVSITDSGSQPFPDFETPDLEAKLKGKQGPRGWGWYLMKNLVDDVRMTSDENHHTVELVLRREGGRDDR
jgi:anti-sigma regulatory factor (Ser/Thr protein kinase)